MTWGVLLNPRLWLVVGVGAIWALFAWFFYSQGGASTRAEMAELRASYAEQGRVAAQARAREEAAARHRERAWQDRFNKEAEDGQKALDVARADADRAADALDGVRKQLAALRSAVGRATADSQPVASGTPAGPAAGVPADVLERLGARIERLGGRAGVYAKFADAAHAAGNTCQRSVDALTPSGVNLFTRSSAAPR